MCNFLSFFFLESRLSACRLPPLACLITAQETWSYISSANATLSSSTFWQSRITRSSSDKQSKHPFCLNKVFLFIFKQYKKNTYKQNVSDYFIIIKKKHCKGKRSLFIPDLFFPYLTQKKEMADRFSKPFGWSFSKVVDLFLV